MAKRSDTLETVLLAVELLRRIPRGRKITASELHQQLKHAGMERELRTIQRQLEMLSEHFEIERDDSSKPYGYRWLEQAKALAVAQPHAPGVASTAIGGGAPQELVAAPAYEVHGCILQSSETQSGAGEQCTTGARMARKSACSGYEPAFVVPQDCFWRV